MIISIQGTLINTSNIYSISEIWETSGKFLFKIESFDKKDLHVYSRSTESLTGTALKDAKLELVLLRDKIVAYWNTSGSEIPKLEIEKL